MSELDNIKTKFDTDLASAYDTFNLDVIDLARSITSQLNAIPSDPLSATANLDRLAVAFGVGIGDEKSGIYGTYIAKVNSIVDTSSQGINKYVKGITFTNQRQVTIVEASIKVLSDHISSSISSNNDKITKLIDTSNNSITATINSVIIKTFDYFITSITDSFIGAINRADEHFTEGVARLVSLYETYKTLPEGFYSDVNTILTELADTYNSDIETANFKYSDSLSNYKYFPDGAQSKIDSSQARIKVSMDKANAHVTELLNTVPSTFVNHSDRIFAAVIVDLSSKLFIESVKLREQMEKSLDRSQSILNDIRPAIDKYMKSKYPKPIYVDGIKYRNNKADIINGLSTLVATRVDNSVTTFNDSVDSLSSNYNVALQNLQGNVIDYINKVVPEMTAEQQTAISDKLSSTVTHYVDKASSIFSSYTARLTSSVERLNRYVEHTISSYFDVPPLIRFVGDFSFPPYVYSGAVNEFRFSVKNLGKRPWVGWFGIRFSSGGVSDAAAGGEGVSFLYNRRLGFETVAPGATVSITVNVPGQLIYSLKDMVGPISRGIVTNTHWGI